MTPLMERNDTQALEELAAWCEKWDKRVVHGQYGMIIWDHTIGPRGYERAGIALGEQFDATSIRKLMKGREE